MNKTQEALKLALEALECDPLDMALNPDGHMGFLKDKAITSIRAALASKSEALAEQPAQQQEPVAYSYTSRITGAQGFSHHPMPRFIDSGSWDIQPLYTSPPASKPWVGLTDEEIDKCYYYKSRQWTTDELVRHVEAKLREKNAQPSKPLTDEQIYSITGVEDRDEMMHRMARNIARAIEAAHGIKGDA